MNSVSNKHRLGKRYSRSTLFSYKRMIIMALALVCIISIMSSAFISKASSSMKNADKRITCVTVHTGDTLWSIANKYCNEDYESVSDLVDEIKSINNMSSDTIKKGNKLMVPYYN